MSRYYSFALGSSSNRFCSTHDFHDSRFFFLFDDSLSSYDIHSLSSTAGLTTNEPDFH